MGAAPLECTLQRASSRGTFHGGGGNRDNNLAASEYPINGCEEWKRRARKRVEGRGEEEGVHAFFAANGLTTLTGADL